MDIENYNSKIKDNMDIEFENNINKIEEIIKGVNLLNIDKIKINIFICVSTLTNEKSYNKGMVYINVTSILYDLDYNININKFNNIKMKDENIIFKDVINTDKYIFNLYYLNNRIEIKNTIWKNYFDFYNLYNLQDKNIIKNIINNKMNNKLNSYINIIYNSNMIHKIKLYNIYLNICKNFELIYI